MLVSPRAQGAASGKQHFGDGARQRVLWLAWRAEEKAHRAAFVARCSWSRQRRSQQAVARAGIYSCRPSERRRAAALG
eukprot:5364588-Pleurochrysis_carterae.AAC.1